MQIAGPSLWIAPLATGHPHGLPGAKRPDKPTTKVQPLDQSRHPDAALARHHAPEHFWKAANGDPLPDEHIAPPTIMQLKISQMLNEQAQDLQTATPKTADDFDPLMPALFAKMPQVGDQKTGKHVELSTQSALTTVKPTLPAYDEAASMSRNDVLSTLP